MTQKQPQNTSKLPYFKKKLTDREKRIVDNFLLKPNDFLTIKQISQDTGIDIRSTRELCENLYCGMLVFKQVQKYHHLVKPGGRRHESQYKVNLFALSTIAYGENKAHKKNNSFLSEIKNREKDKELFNKIFNFKIFGVKNNGRI